MNSIRISVCYTVLAMLFVLLLINTVYAENSTPQYHWFASINVGSTYYQMSAEDAVSDGQGFLYVVGGTRPHGGTYDVFVAKINLSNGSIAWVKSIGGGNDDYGEDIVLYGGSFLYITGYTSSYGAGDFDIFLAKLNTDDGSLEWLLTIGTSNREKAYALTLGDNGSIYITGACEGYDTTLCVIKINPESKSVEWFRLYGGSNYDTGYDIAYSNGVVYVAGTTIATEYKKYYDVYVLAINSSNGELLWSMAFGTPGTGDTPDDGQAIKVVNNSLYVAGMYGGGKFFLAEINRSSQEFIWARTYGMDTYGGEMDLEYIEGGGLVLGGSTASFGAGSADMVVANLYSEDGSIKWVRTLGGGKIDRCNGLTVSPKGYIYAVGQTSSFTEIEYGFNIVVALVSETIEDTLTWLNSTGWSQVQVTAPTITVTSIVPETHRHHNNVNTVDPTVSEQTISANTISRNFYIATDNNPPTPIPEPWTIALVVTLSIVLLINYSKLRETKKLS